MPALLLCKEGANACSAPSKREPLAPELYLPVGWLIPADTWLSGKKQAILQRTKRSVRAKRSPLLTKEGVGGG